MSYHDFGAIRSVLTLRRLVSREMKFDGCIFDRFDEMRILNLINTVTHSYSDDILYNVYRVRHA